MIERVVVASLNWTYPQTGILRALEKIFGKENVADYDFMSDYRRFVGKAKINENFKNVVRRMMPDWVFMPINANDLIEPETIIELRRESPACVFSNWMGDCRSSVHPTLAAMSRACHLTLVSNVGQIPLFKAAGANDVRYCQIGLDYDEDVLGTFPFTPSFRVPDVVMCGHYYHHRPSDSDFFPGTAERLQAIMYLYRAKFDVGVIGHGWPKGVPNPGSCHVKAQHHVWKRAKVGLNINHFNNVELYYSDRQLISMASGTPVVCRYVPGLEREFKDGVHCFFYRELPELASIVQKLLADDELRKRVGQAGRQHVIENHTWERRFRDLIPVIEEVRNRI